LYDWDLKFNDWVMDLEEEANNKGKDKDKDKKCYNYKETNGCVMGHNMKKI